MKLLLIHNHYRERGGEDSVFLKDAAMLQRAGHAVHLAIKDSRKISGLKEAAEAAWNLSHSAASAEEISGIVDRVRPDVVHIHNLFPLWTTSVLAPARSRGGAVVVTLHNFRMFCANGLFLRNDRPCTSCISGDPLPGLLHRCYRNSWLATIPMTRQIALARKSGVWLKNVDLFLALSKFSRGLFITGGLPENRIRVRPNFCEEAPASGTMRADGFLFVGRLSREKGVANLLQAFSSLPHRLRVVGSGPDLERLRANAPANVVFLGQLSQERVAEEMSAARAIIVPSLCFENFPMVIAEAYRAGTPVIASHLGSLSELVEEGKTGALFDCNNPLSLRDAIFRLTEYLPSNLSANCRKRWETEFSEPVVRAHTEALYAEAMRIRRATA